MSDREIATISALLCQHLGLEVSSIGVAAMVAAVDERVKECRMPLEQYAVHVQHERGELAKLVDTIIVPESWFFRDRVPFQHLAAYGVKLVRKGRRLRVLSAPSSTGEEPYSVAMSLVESGIDPSLITIDAIDVSPPLLVSARAGIYRSSSFRGVDEKLRNAYFTPRADAETWELNEVIRRMVKFRASNLLAPDVFLGEQPYDIILCRNLLIYLTADARGRLLDKFIKLLADSAILVVGHAEALEVIDKRFQNIGVPGAFTYQLRGTDEASASSSFSAVPKPRKLTPAPMQRLDSRPIDTRPIDLRPTVPTPPQIKPDIPRDLLLDASALANKGQLVEAAALVEQYLAIVGTDANGWSMLGTIRQAAGDPLRAEECFSRAVYCDPTMYTALVQLALLLEKRGEVAGAQKLRARADRAKAGKR